MYILHMSICTYIYTYIIDIYWVWHFLFRVHVAHSNMHLNTLHASLRTPTRKSVFLLIWYAPTHAVTDIHAQTHANTHAVTHRHTHRYTDRHTDRYTTTTHTYLGNHMREPVLKLVPLVVSIHIHTHTYTYRCVCSHKPQYPHERPCVETVPSHSFSTCMHTHTHTYLYIHVYSHILRFPHGGANAEAIPSHYPSTYIHTLK